MSKRTLEEINEVITLLKEQRDTLPRFSAFGDDNHRTIELQIEAIEQCDRWEDETQVYDQYDDEDDAYPMVAAWHWATGNDLYRDEIL